jgi:hypothetical protein
MAVSRFTYHSVSDGNIAEKITRFNELATRESMARAIAIKKARGEYQPNKYVNEENFPPLTVDEHLEMLAIGEYLARYYRHPSQVHSAVLAGVSWEQIADAVGATTEATRDAYRTWADGQHRLYADIGIGMDDEAYAQAMRLVA